MNVSKNSAGAHHYKGLVDVVYVKQVKHWDGMIANYAYFRKVFCYEDYTTAIFTVKPKQCKELK